MTPHWTHPPIKQNTNWLFIEKTSFLCLFSLMNYGQFAGFFCFHSIEAKMEESFVKKFRRKDTNNREEASGLCFLRQEEIPHSMRDRGGSVHPNSWSWVFCRSWICLNLNRWRNASFSTLECLLRIARFCSFMNWNNSFKGRNRAFGMSNCHLETIF